MVCPAESLRSLRERTEGVEALNDGKKKRPIIIHAIVIVIAMQSNRDKDSIVEAYLGKPSMPRK